MTIFRKSVFNTGAIISLAYGWGSGSVIGDWRPFRHRLNDQFILKIKKMFFSNFVNILLTVHIRYDQKWAIYVRFFELLLQVVF